MACTRTLSHVSALLPAVIPSCLRYVQREAGSDVKLRAVIMSSVIWTFLILFCLVSQAKRFFSFQACEWLLILLNYSLTFFLFMFTFVALDTVQSEWQNWYDQA